MERLCYVAIFSALMAGFLLGGGEADSPIALLTNFENTPSDISVQEMKKEFGRLMKSTGLEFDWRQVPQLKEVKTDPEGIRLKFKGNCHTGGPQPPEISELAPYGESFALASTKVSKGRVLPDSEVQCDQIRKCLGARAGTTQLQRDLLLGRAMGRVVAHELYHILVGTTKHAGKGVVKAIQSTADLVSEGAEFGSTQLENLGEPGHSGASGFKGR
jgi:hypothetical protein